MDQKKIGGFLRELRKERGLTQEQLSEILGVTNRSISRWENGVNMPDFDLVIEITKYFDVKIEEFLDGERKMGQMDKREEENLLRTADYCNEEKEVFSKRLHWMFLAAVLAFLVYVYLEVQGLSDTGVYEDVASFALGLVFGMLLVGTLYTSRYIKRIQNLKKRLLKRQG